MDDGAKVDPTNPKIPVLVQYVTTHGTWDDRNELWHLLSERVVRIALRLADEQRAARDAQRTLQQEAVDNLPPHWLKQQMRDPQYEPPPEWAREQAHPRYHLAPELCPETRRES